MSEIERQTGFLRGAINHIRLMIGEKEEADREYDDIVAMLELAGSKVVAPKIRQIQNEERRFVKILQHSLEILEQRLKYSRMEIERLKLR